MEIPEGYVLCNTHRVSLETLNFLNVIFFRKVSFIIIFSIFFFSAPFFFTFSNYRMSLPDQFSITFSPCLLLSSLPYYFEFLGNFTALSSINVNDCVPSSNCYFLFFSSFLIWQLCFPLSHYPSWIYVILIVRSHILLTKLSIGSSEKMKIPSP